MNCLVKKHDPKSGSAAFFYFNVELMRKYNFRAKMLYNTYVERNFVPKQFITLTYAEPYYYFNKKEKQTPGAHWRIFMNRLKSYCAKEGMEKPSFVRVVENGALNGRIHIHALLSESFPKEMIDKWWGKCVWDALDVKDIDSESTQMVSCYLMKYFTKDYKDETSEFKESDEYMLPKDILEHKLYYKPIEGQRFSSSRNFTKIPVGNVLKFHKVLNEQTEGLKFTMQFYIEPSKYANYTTVWAQTDQIKIERKYSELSDEIMCLMHEKSYKKLISDVNLTRKYIQRMHVDSHVEKVKRQISYPGPMYNGVQKQIIEYTFDNVVILHKSHKAKKSKPLRAVSLADSVKKSLKIL